MGSIVIKIKAMGVCAYLLAKIKQIIKAYNCQWCSYCWYI